LEINDGKIFTIPSHQKSDVIELAETIGVKKETISRRISLLVLPEDVQNPWSTMEISILIVDHSKLHKNGILHIY